MKFLLTAGGVILEPVRATLVRRLGGLSRWELGFHRKSGKESPLAKAAPLVGATAAGGMLVVRTGAKAGGKEVVLATKLRVVGGREEENEVRLELSESALDENHLAVHRHAHVADDGGCGQTVGDVLGNLLASVGVADDAKTGFCETPAPVLLQHDESLVDLALPHIWGYFPLERARSVSPALG